MTLVHNILAVIGGIWLVCAIALAMFLAACWSVTRKAGYASGGTVPTRESVEWQLIIAAVEDEGLHPATAAHIAKWEAEAIDAEWAEWGGAA